MIYLSSLVVWFENVLGLTINLGKSKLITVRDFPKVII